MNRRKLEAIADVNQAADGLTAACEAYLGRRIPNDPPVIRLVHDAYRELQVLPPEIAVQLPRVK